MRFRSIAIRVVLVIATLATVATSAPRDFFLTDVEIIDLSGPLTVRVFGRANPPAFEHADSFSMEIHLFAETGQVTLIPDNPAVPVTEVVFAPDSQVFSFQVEADDTWCPREAGTGCELGVSIEVAEGVAVTLDVEAGAVAQGDPSFFFPENREFPEDAVIEVGFNE